MGSKDLLDFRFLQLIDLKIKWVGYKWGGCWYKIRKNRICGRIWGRTQNEMTCFKSVVLTKTGSLVFLQLGFG